MTRPASPAFAVARWLTPKETVPDVKAAILMAVMTEQRPTIRSVMRAAGLSSSSSAWFHLIDLRAMGLVTWTKGKRGTLRPTVRVVAIDPHWR